MIKFSKYLYLFFILVWASTVFSQETEHLFVKTFTNRDIYGLKDTIKIAIEINIKEKYHINSFFTEDPSFIKTNIIISESDFKECGKFFPPHKMYKFEFSDSQIPVYEGKIIIGINAVLNKELSYGQYEIPLKFTYQACDNSSCYPPKNIENKIKIKIGETSSQEINKNIFSAIDYTKFINEEKQTLTENTKTEFQNQDEQKVSGFIEEKGMILGFLVIFIWGLALNLTPCIYPLIPITISFFGAQSSGSRTQSIFMGVFYAIGMSVTYSLLGLFAALTGSILGTALQNPIVIIFIALIFLGLASSMFGLWEIRVPQKLALAGNKNRSGYFGSLLMGLLVGFIAAPCIGPIVLSLLVYVGKIGNPFLGFLLFFILSMGLGFPYIFLAAFSSSIGKLPRSGEWMIGVKIIFGLVLIIMAINTIGPILPDKIFNIIFPVSIILSSIYLILIDNKGSNSKVYTRIKYFIAISGIIFGTWILKPESKSEEVNWKVLNSVEQIENSVKTEGKPVIIDFYADWCAQCKELDKYTYTNKEVAELSKSTNNIKIDLTKENNEIVNKFGIKGLPVVIFMKSNGEELRELRITGFVEPEIFIQKMNKLLEANK